MMISSCLLMFLWIQTPAGAAIDVSPFRYSREIPAAPPGLSNIPLDAAVLAHSRSDQADLRIVDAGNQQIPYVLERRGDVLSVPLNLLLPENEVPPPRHSYYRLVLPFENLPAAKLVMTTAERVFQRSILVRVKRDPPNPRSEQSWETVANATWLHKDSAAAAPPLALDLRAGLGTTEMIVDVDEGDNRPLALGDFQLELPAYQLRFFYPEDGPLTLLYGHDALSAPRYDLELLAPQLTGAASNELALGEERMAPAPQDDERAKTVLWIALVVAVVAVLAMLIRLLRAQRTESGGSTSE